MITQEEYDEIYGKAYQRKREAHANASDHYVKPKPIEYYIMQVCKDRWMPNGEWEAEENSWDI